MVNGLRQQIEQLKLFMNTPDIEIPLINEYHLTSKIKLNNLNHLVYRDDRNQYGVVLK